MISLSIYSDQGAKYLSAARKAWLGWSSGARRLSNYGGFALDGVGAKPEIVGKRVIKLK